jgi:hypothetical protein
LLICQPLPHQIHLCTELGLSFGASRCSVTRRLLDIHPGSLEPYPEVGGLLNAPVDPHRSFVPLVLYLLPRVASQTECQFSLFIAKVNFAGLVRQRHHDEPAVESHEKIKKSSKSTDRGRSSKLQEGRGRRSKRVKYRYEGRRSSGMKCRKSGQSKER